MEISPQTGSLLSGNQQVGFTDLTADWKLSQTVSFLVNPGHPIPPQTRAVHHISDADVADAITPDVAMRTLMAGMQEGDVFAAHNCKFEQAFFGGGNHRWICTMQAAKHLFPDAPGFSNQVLRYWLNLDADMADVNRAMPPHRAGPDTYVTALLLARLLYKAPLDELVRLTTAPVLLRDVTFGKHKGMKWADLPWDYLNWVANKSDLGADEKHTARHYLAGK
jgi:exodeoxyribonuclease X